MARISRPLVALSVAAVAVAFTANPVRAAGVVFSDNFETDTGQWTFSSSIGSSDLSNDGYQNEGNAFFDYSSLVPSANGAAGGGTHGMKVVADLPNQNGTGTFGGVTMTLNNQTFDFANKAYKVTAKVWLNYYGGTTSGTTEEVVMGVGANPGTSQFPGGAGFNSVGFSTSTDGDTNSDWRAYKTPWPAEGTGAVQRYYSGVYASDPAGTNSLDISVAKNDLDSANDFYPAHFPGGEVPPDLQKNAFTNQQPGSTGMPASAGTVAFAWHTWTIETSPNGGAVTWKVSDASGQDITIATIQGGAVNPYTLGGSSLYFGMFDINGSPPPAGFDADKLLFGLIDNVTVLERLPGDANDDGVVNADDYALIDRGAAKHLTGWSNGDFNGDGVVDSSDYLVIDTAWAAGHPPSPDFLAGRAAEFGDAYVQSLIASVPEPTTGLAAVILSAAATTIGRRRRHAEGYRH